MMKFNKSFTPSILLLLFFILSSSFSNKTNLSNDHLNYGVPVSNLVAAPIVFENFSIFIQKSSYSLFLKYNGKVIKSYPCVFGSDPISDKLKQGDMSTPEGDFYITDVREHFIWGFFLAIDYPTEHSWYKHNEAKQNGKIAETDDIGGSVGIHGVIDGLESYIDTKNNWTEGCISLKNTDVNELATYIKSGTPIKIVY